MESLFIEDHKVGLLFGVLSRGANTFWELLVVTCIRVLVHAFSWVLDGFPFSSMAPWLLGGQCMSS